VIEIFKFSGRQTKSVSKRLSIKDIDRSGGTRTSRRAPQSIDKSNVFREYSQEIGGLILRGEELLLKFRIYILSNPSPARQLVGKTRWVFRQPQGKSSAWFHIGDLETG
jgi:hypothetical protein